MKESVIATIEAERKAQANRYNLAQEQIANCEMAVSDAQIQLKQARERVALDKQRETSSAVEFEDLRQCCERHQADLPLSLGARLTQLVGKKRAASDRVRDSVAAEQRCDDALDEVKAKLELAKKDRAEAQYEVQRLNKILLEEASRC